jgi:hypothetical protein
MALRASADVVGVTVDPSAVTNPSRASASGIAYAEELSAFADALVAANDESEMAAARRSVERKLGPDRLVDVAAVASNFQRMARVADSTGIPIDAPMNVLSSDMRAELGIDAFGSSANTPPPGVLQRAIAALIRPVAIPLMVWNSKRMRKH